jgi:hypothetical protein
MPCIVDCLFTAGPLQGLEPGFHLVHLRLLDSLLLRGLAGRDRVAGDAYRHQSLERLFELFDERVGAVYDAQHRPDLPPQRIPPNDYAEPRDHCEQNYHKPPRNRKIKDLQRYFSREGHIRVLV